MIKNYTITKINTILYALEIINFVQTEGRISTFFLEWFLEQIRRIFQLTRRNHRQRGFQDQFSQRLVDSRNLFQKKGRHKYKQHLYSNHRNFLNRQNNIGLCESLCSNKLTKFSICISHPISRIFYQIQELSCKNQLMLKVQSKREYQFFFGPFYCDQCFISMSKYVHKEELQWQTFYHQKSNWDTYQGNNHLVFQQLKYRKSIILCHLKM